MKNVKRSCERHKWPAIFPLKACSFSMKTFLAILVLIVGFSVLKSQKEKNLSLDYPSHSDESNPVLIVGLGEFRRDDLRKAKEILNKGSFNIELNSLKEEDIVGYLTMNGDDVDAALVASSIDGQNLPEAEEYIYNDNALNDFLNELNIDHQTPNSN